MTKDELIYHLEEYGNDRFKDGIIVGLRIVDKVLGWLNRVPDTNRQRETRKWLEKEVDILKKKYSL